MPLPTYNPYKIANPLFSDGLDYIIANIPADPTYTDVVDTIEAYLETLPDSFDSVPPLVSVAYNSANDYMNSRIAQNLNFGANEWAFVDAVLQGIKDNSIDSLAEFLAAAEQQLAEAEINTATKTSLYASLGLTYASYNYWLTAVTTTPNAWDTYLNANAAINYANIPHWVAATFVSSLSGFAQFQSPGINQVDILTTSRFTAIEGLIVGALGVTAGKVIVKWARRPVMNCGCGG